MLHYIVILHGLWLRIRNMVIYIYNLCTKLITHVAGKWRGASNTCELMYFQITLLCEQLIIHITGKWGLSTK